MAWDAKQKLTWHNFKGKVPPLAAAAATTASGISYEYTANMRHHEVELDFTVTAYFYPNDSWYKPKVCNDHILQHEQLHFDIAEIFARKMRLKLQQTTFTKKVKAEINKIYRQTIKEMNTLQEQYDLETNFSRDSSAQNTWNTRIAEALVRMPQ